MVMKPANGKVLAQPVIFPKNRKMPTIKRISPMMAKRFIKISFNDACEIITAQKGKEGELPRHATGVFPSWGM